MNTEYIKWHATVMHFNIAMQRCVIKKEKANKNFLVIKSIKIDNETWLTILSLRTGCREIKMDKKNAEI